MSKKLHKLIGQLLRRADSRTFQVKTVNEEHFNSRKEIKSELWEEFKILLY
jgi:hypothetical protein